MNDKLKIKMQAGQNDLFNVTVTLVTLTQAEVEELVEYLEKRFQFSPKY